MDITRKGKEVWKKIKGVGEFPLKEDYDMYEEGMEQIKNGETKNLVTKLNRVDDWSTIKHFKPEEFSCKCGSCHGQLGINFDLVLMLDALRQLYEGPIRINSGYRCDNHPKTLNNPTSSHNVGGNAVDISVKTSAARYKLLKIIFDNRLFRRIGIGKEYLHLDIDPDKSLDLVWDYY